ncbi:hypothetical protein HanRHA438_Chr00c38g0856631 [Helianthus annuus]|nr:hypothetical protein HanRHA438_Chr00c38g0856631 [Helianthus annuus]
MFTLASYMIMVSAKACHLPELVSLVRSTLIEETVDPYLVLDGDIRLRAVCTKAGDKNCYGSHENEACAMKSLVAIEAKDQKLKDALSSHFVSCLGTSSQAQLSEWFLPDDEYPMGTQEPFSLQDFDEVIPSANEDPLDRCGSQSDPRAAIDSLDIISVSQLLDSVAETAEHVESMPNSSITLTFDEIKNQCEALVMGKQQKMSVLQSFKEQQEAMAIISSGEHEKYTPVTSNNVRISIPLTNIFLSIFDNIMCLLGSPHYP